MPRSWSARFLHAVLALAAVVATTPLVAAEKVTGIGGFFFRAQAPTALAAWYRDQLGIELAPGDYDAQPWRQEAGVTVFAPFPSTTDYWPAEKQWMINFRVASLDAMVAQLQRSGIAVEVDPTAYPNGRFAHLSDPEGNPLELWEPAP